MPRDFRTEISFGLRPLVAIAATVLLAILATLQTSAQELDPNSPPPANDYVSCGHFETQEDAQAALDSGELDEIGMQSLDGDGDGIACEVRWGEPATGATDTGQETTGVVSLPNTGVGPGETSANGGLLASLSLLLSGVMLLSSRRLARQ